MLFLNPSMLTSLMVKDIHEVLYNVHTVCKVGVSIPIITSEKTFRKNGINVGMASTSIGRKEMGFSI